MNLVRAATIGLVVFSFNAGFTLEATASERSSRSAKAAKEELKYPDAERADPKGTVSSRLSSTMNKLIKAFNDDKHEQTLKLADEVLANQKANAFERAKAAQIAAYSWNSNESENAYVESMRYIKTAIDADALPNNDHYDLMFMLAQLQLAEEQYAESLVSVERFLEESKIKRPVADALRGNALFRLERYKDSADAFSKAIAGESEPDKNWTQMLIASYFELNQPLDAAKVAEELVLKNPNDKALLLNLVSIYLQAEKPDEAGRIFDRIRSQGLLTESKDYENAYKLLANIDGREKDAVAVINEGLQKGILKESFDVYNYLGQANYFSDQVEPAIAAWTKAAPLAKDGETYLNVAKVLVIEGRYSDGKLAAQQALAKGVKKPGDVWMAIARAEFGDDGKNRAAVLAAYREAAKFPETKAQAEKAIAQMSR